MADSRDNLRVASDALLRDLEILESLEERKRTLDLANPQVTDLARRIETLARRILASSGAQRSITEDAQLVAAERGPGVSVGSIEDTPRAAHEILLEWRHAERRLADVDPGSAEAVELGATVVALREEYRRAFEAARRR
ncbi:MAG TPA: hypothetical protein VF802_05605 [Candidatus Limnocylindrales bacterium]